MKRNNSISRSTSIISIIAILIGIAALAILEVSKRHTVELQSYLFVAISIALILISRVQWKIYKEIHTKNNAGENSTRLNIEPESENRTWTCTKCGEICEANFTECWKCEAPKGD